MPGWWNGRIYFINMYEDYIKYGPYDHGNRLRLVLINKYTGKKTSISYAKYLIELSLGRYLKPDETVDHIDNNYKNNELNNLRVLTRSKHCSEDVLRNKPHTFKCQYCGKLFIRYKRGNRHGHGYFCSRTCSGKYGVLIKSNKIKPIDIPKILHKKYRIKNEAVVEKLVNSSDLSSDGH